MPEQKTSKEIRDEIAALTRQQMAADLLALDEQIARLQLQRQLLAKRIELADALDSEAAAAATNSN